MNKGIPETEARVQAQATPRARNKTHQAADNDDGHHGKVQGGYQGPEMKVAVDNHRDSLFIQLLY
ncbi:MAG: hypothetical protein M0Z31_07685 [Clostridia bacterium]|nr:hypothetical protein [Clostridia bacterium]